MKQKFYFILLAVFPFIGYSQTPTESIKLKENQELNIQSTTKGNINQEMYGQNIESSFNSFTKKNLSVTKVSKDGYNIDLKTSKLKMNVSMMGNDVSKFDSDDQKDNKGGQSSIGDDINVPKKLFLNKTGFCISLDSTSVTNQSGKDKIDPMSKMMMDMMGNKTDESSTESYFMLLHENAKQGDTWVDSSRSDKISTNLSYHWDSTFNKDIVLISISGKMIFNSVVEVMGSEATISIISDILETRKVNSSNGIIQYKKSISQMRGTIDVMGFSIPVTGTIESLSEIE